MAQKVHSKEDKKKFIEIFRKKNGHITKACTAYNINRSTYYDWMKEEWFADEIEHYRQLPCLMPGFRHCGIF